MRRRRIVHVTSSDISLALLLGPQLRAFAAAGYEVIGASAPGPHVEELESWGIRHEPLAHATRSMTPRTDVQALFELRALFRRIEPDLVHTHNPKPGLYGRIAARLARVPAVVNTIHGLYVLPEDPLAKRAVFYSLERLAAACSDAELLQNVEDIDVLRRLRVPERKLHLLGNGIDLRRFDPERVDPARTAELRASFGAGPDDIVCGVVGRLVWEKGYREVFEAARRLRSQAPPRAGGRRRPLRAVEGRRDLGRGHLGGRARRRRHVPRDPRRPRGRSTRPWTCTCSRPTAKDSRARPWKPPRSVDP